MPSLTPVRIRGKRDATKGEKWRSGKKRKTGVSTSDARSFSILTDSATVNSGRPKRRKRRHVELSRLEELPTEVIQTIFENSANLNLPLTSPRLASQLASQHLYRQLTSRILDRLVQRVGTAEELRDAMRLMNSRFFTWSFLKDWISEAMEKRSMPKDVLRLNWKEHLAVGGDGLLPPKKLLRSPFTSDKVDFLHTVTPMSEVDPRDAVYSELVEEGLVQFVKEGAEGAERVIWSLTKLGARPDAELMRIAVIDNNCDKKVIHELICASTAPIGTSVRKCRRKIPMEEMNYLDPALWSWAESARKRGDENGEWLMGVLRSAARHFEQTSAKTEHAGSEVAVGEGLT